MNSISDEILKIIASKKMEGAEIRTFGEPDKLIKTKILKQEAESLIFLESIYNFFCIRDCWLYHILFLDDPYNYLNERICRLNIDQFCKYD